MCPIFLQKIISSSVIDNLFELFFLFRHHYIIFKLKSFFLCLYHLLVSYVLLIFGSDQLTLDILGNTRVVNQKELEFFREELQNKLSSNYNVILKERKLPLSLLHDHQKVGAFLILFSLSFLFSSFLM